VMYLAGSLRTWRQPCRLGAAAQLASRWSVGVQISLIWARR
jgi:hypothetical protein